MDVKTYPINQPVIQQIFSDQPVYKVMLPMTVENASCRGWLLKNVGTMADVDKNNQWRPLSAKYPWTSRAYTGKTLFMFYRKEDAMLFTLRWL